MKRLFKFLLWVFISIAILLLLVIGVPMYLLHMKTEAPIDQYVESSETAFYTSFNHELESLITDSEKDTIFLRIDEAFINRMIQNMLSEDNPKYLSQEHIHEFAYDHMMVFGSFAGLKGVWTKLSDDQLIVTAGADLSFSKNLVYQSGLEIVFDIVLSENEEYYLKVAEISVGRMTPTLRRAFGLANSIVNLLTKNSLNDLIAEYLPFGVFDDEELSFTVSETELTDYLHDVEPSFAALLKIVYQESLIVLDVSDLGFDVSVQIGVFRKLSSDPDEPSFTRWENDIDKALYMSGFAAQAITNSALHPLDPRIDLTEADVNSILDYTLSDKVQFSFPIEFTLGGEEIVYNFDSTNLFVRMNDDVLSIHLTMTLSKEGMAGAFEMQFNLESIVSMNQNGDMVLTISNANIGEVNLDNDTLSSLFALFDESLMVDNTIVIPSEDLNEMFAGSGIIINDSYVVDGILRLHFGLDI